MEVYKTPSDVLVFFRSPTGHYMGHFFHFKDDPPVAKEKINKKKTFKKTIYDTNKGKLLLSDIDTIIDKYEENNKAISIKDISKVILPKKLLKEFEDNHLKLENVLEWAKKEAEKIFKDFPKTAKTSKQDHDVKILIDTLIQLEPNRSPEELKTKLVQLAKDEDRLNKAVEYLNNKIAANKEKARSTKGYIMLKVRKSK